MAKILVVDDEITMLQMTVEHLRRLGHNVVPCRNAPLALEALENDPPDLVIADLYIEKNRPLGLEILAKAKALHPPPVVIVVTGYATVETAVEAMKKGAFDYLEKPFKLDEFTVTVQRALQFNEAVSENVFLRKQLDQKYNLDRIIGRSGPMQEVFKLVGRVADTDSNILILGESGTGKELVARALHFNSRRRFAPFIPINCAALPENLLESELFGHRKGAFTGAIADKKGLFHEADGGTIFLDEIGTMPALLQSRLLRVLQDKEIRRVGDTTPAHVNVRVLAATNEPLEKKIHDGSFREDLFYRLNVIAIKLPPLRERRDDLPLLVGHFLKNKMHARSGQPFQMSRQAMQTLCAWHWPGNVRELENAIERACALCEGDILQARDLPPQILAAVKNQPPVDLPSPCAIVEDLPPEDGTIYPLPNPPPPGVEPLPTPPPAPGAAAPPPANGNGNGNGGAPRDLKNFLREQEQAFINRALAQANGDKVQAAELLGVSLATLYRKLSMEGEA